MVGSVPGLPAAELLISPKRWKHSPLKGNIMRESRFNIWFETGAYAYVFNGLSGTLLKLPSSQYSAFRKFAAGDLQAECSPAVLANMAVGMMIIPDTADEIGDLATRYKSTRGDPTHLGLTVITSLGCNFDCPYCFEQKHPSVLSEDVQRFVVQMLYDRLAHIKSFSVTWFGGEPLVGRKPLAALSEKFIAGCDSYNVEYEASIITNGYLLDRETSRFLSSVRVKNAQVGIDWPPDIHDKMRPLANGKGNFWTLIENIKESLDYINITIRVNIDQNNFAHVEELFRILHSEGLAGKIDVYPGQIVGVSDNPLAPSAAYKGCFSNRAFAEAEREFMLLADRYGLASTTLPRPTGAPCTAVRANEYVVGSTGELYKCWDTVGDRKEVIGHIADCGDLNGRLAKWLSYDPFENEECRGCIALPVCMGGCAHHAFDTGLYENRCGTFRHTYREQIARYVAFADQHDVQSPIKVSQLARRMETR
jgi:uncharacterized protein